MYFTVQKVNVAANYNLNVFVVVLGKKSRTQILCISDNPEKGMYVQPKMKVINFLNAKRFFLENATRENLFISIN